MSHVAIVAGAVAHPQALRATRHGRIFDRLHIDGEAIEQASVMRLVVPDRDEQRYDMARVVHDRQARHLEPAFQRMRPLLMPLALGITVLRCLMLTTAPAAMAGQGGREKKPGA